MAFAFGPRRGEYIDIGETLSGRGAALRAEELAHLEAFDLIYRSLCALLYNYVPMSGHPGGSISSGRFVAGSSSTRGLRPRRPRPRGRRHRLYAAGHKAMGLYAMWALRDEVAARRASRRCCRPTRSSACGSRTCSASAATRSPRRRCSASFRAKALDGHPTPATPFVRLSTGASGVGVASSIGLAFGARDRYGAARPACTSSRARAA